MILSNGSETIKIEDADNSTVLEFTYDDDWYKETDGEGFTLVISSESGPAENWETRGGWRSSAATGGSPGESDPQARAGDFSGDRSTNRADVVKLVENFGRTAGSYRSRGDANLDGATSLVDLAIVQANFGEGVAAAPSAQANSQLEAVDAVFTGFSRGTEQGVKFSSRVRRPMRTQHRGIPSGLDPSSDSATAMSRPDRSHSSLQLRTRRRLLRSLEQNAPQSKRP